MWGGGPVTLYHFWPARSQGGGASKQATKPEEKFSGEVCILPIEKQMIKCHHHHHTVKQRTKIYFHTTYIILILNISGNHQLRLWIPLGQNRLIQAMQINEEKLSILDNQVLNANGPIYHSQIVAWQIYYTTIAFPPKPRWQWGSYGWL